jgi:hypothetical protein
MIVIIIYTIISFLLDGLLSNYMSINIIDPSYFRTIYSIISLVIIYNYFDNNTKYLKILLVLGMFFDIVYTNTFLLNVVIFLIIYLIIKKINIFIPNNIFTINLKSILSITIYHILSYLILLLSNYHNYSIRLLTLILSRSIIVTIIYTTISYLLLKKIYFKIYDKKIK